MKRILSSGWYFALCLSDCQKLRLTKCSRLLTPMVMIIELWGDIIIWCWWWDMINIFPARKWDIWVWRVPNDAGSLKQSTTVLIIKNIMISFLLAMMMVPVFGATRVKRLKRFFHFYKNFSYYKLLLFTFTLHKRRRSNKEGGENMLRWNWDIL